jgi:hypothetical protein
VESSNDNSKPLTDSEEFEELVALFLEPLEKRTEILSQQQPATSEQSRGEPPKADQTSQADILWEHVAHGVCTATELVKAMGISKGRISQLTAKLIEQKRLTKRGRFYLLPKSRRFTSDSAPQIAIQAAPVKAEKAFEGKESPVAQNALDGHFDKIPRHAVEIVKTRAFHTLSREHWAAYTSPNTISQETGLPPGLMLRSDLKELTDNALDYAQRHRLPGLVTVSQDGPNTFTVTNPGPGWNASLEEFAQFFSLARGTISSKLWRELTRGALGKGLQGVVGSVASGGGHIIVEACNRRIILRPNIQDGLTAVEEVTEVEKTEGTSITIEVDPAYPQDPDALRWARLAIRLARTSNPPYLGRTSAHWFDTDAFYGLLHAVLPDTTLREFLTKFVGCQATALWQRIAQRFGPKCLCRRLTRDAAAELLKMLQFGTNPIKAHRLGPMGRQAWPDYCDGYAVASDYYSTGARAPFARIPFLAECWVMASAASGDGDDATEIHYFTVNRSPAIAYCHCDRKRGRSAILTFNGCKIDLSLPRAQISFALNLTSPYVPILSSGKLPDLNPFANIVKKAVETAAARACRSMRRATAPNSDCSDDEVAPDAGPLRRILEGAVIASGYTVKELTVLSDDRDPYRLDTVRGHRNAKWFAEMVERFWAPEDTVHLRGSHYVIGSAADVRLPDGGLYINNNEMWEWLGNKAAKAARWLGYVHPKRIVDERNAPPELYLPPYYNVKPERGSGEQIVIPSLEKALPGFTSLQWPVVQPYRIILLGEKISLRPILLPIAQMVGGELLLPTGEISDTLIYELAARCALDPRPSVVLYFSDFDPSGYQMPISVARKLQALHDLHYPSLKMQLHQVALTLPQVRAWNLPSTPLKATEKRAEHWMEIMEHEQTEIDALAALRPEVLREIALEAIKPFYDPSLTERTQNAEIDWQAKSKDAVTAQPAYQKARKRVRLSLETVQRTVQKLQRAQRAASAAIKNVEPPAIELPQAEIESDTLKPKPLFDSDDDFVTTSRYLLKHKQLKLTEE